MDIAINIPGLSELAASIGALARAVDGHATSPGAATALPNEEKLPEGEKTKDPSPVVTLEEVRAKLAGLSQAGKQTEVRALIQKFGASKLTEIPGEKFAEVLKKAEAI